MDANDTNEQSTKPLQREKHPDEEKQQKQYDTLREEAVSLFEETRRMEVYTVVAVAALYAWLLKENPQGIHVRALFIGTGLVLLAGIRCYVLRRRIQDTAKYLLRIEEFLFGANPPHVKNLPGWEHYLSRGKGKPKPLSWVAVAFWIILFVATIIAPIWIERVREAKASGRQATVDTSTTNTTQRMR